MGRGVTPGGAGARPAVDCEVSCISGIDPKTAEIPDRSSWWASTPGGVAPYCRIVVDGRMVVLRPQRRVTSLVNTSPSRSPQPEGQTVLVGVGVLGMVHRERRAGTLSPETARGASIHWLRHTTDGQLALIGLALAIAAEMIKVALTIGSAFPMIVVGAPGIVLLNVVAVAFTIGGLALVVWKGLLAGR